MEKYSPIKWLAEFKRSITTISCKVSGKPVSLHKGINTVIAELKRTQRENNFVWWVGNGGSAAICAHLSQDLLNKLKIKSIVLSDASLLTCMANDYGYHKVYSEPLETLAKSGDLLIAISSSGKSANILECARLALQKKMKLITLSGFGNKNPLWLSTATVSFHLAANSFGQVEVGHELLLHSIIETMYRARIKNK